MNRRIPLILATASLLTGFCAAAASPADVSDEHIRKIFSDVDGFWSEQFKTLGGSYRSPMLQIYSGAMEDVCSLHSTLVGPFYCPNNQVVYIDQDFLERVVKRTRPDEGFALGYLIAHEVAHHVQAEIGTTAVVEQSRSSSTSALANRTLTTMELQADCYAGLWAKSAATRGEISIPSNIQGTLDALAATGMEQQAHLKSGWLMPDPLTQGTELQRVRWFKRGLDSGLFADCNTFSAEAAGKL